MQYWVFRLRLDQMFINFLKKNILLWFWNNCQSKKSMVWEYLTFKNIELQLHKFLGSKVKRQRRVHNRFSPGLPSLHSTLDTKCWLFPDKSKIETISKLKKSDTLLTKHNDYNGDVLSKQLLIDAECKLRSCLAHW